MFSPLSRWPALSLLLFLGATVSPSSLQGQPSTAPARGIAAARALTAVANPFLVSTAAQPRAAETNILSTMVGPAPVTNPFLPLSDALLVPIGLTMPVPASPLALNMAPKQDSGLNLGSNLALMVIGGAGLVVGLVMDSDAGTIISVGGGVVFLIGFYRWLR